MSQSQATQPQNLDDALEQAFWELDARLNGTHTGRKLLGLGIQEPRAAFKEVVRPLITADQRRHRGTGIITSLLAEIGEDPSREGLQETPERVLKAWKHWCQGYQQNPADVLKTFADGAEGVDEMVVVRNIEFYSHCEHHMAPFFGKATVAYIPGERIVGLSKLARVVDIFARRLQVQERLTNQIADCLVENLAPVGVGVIMEAQHFCMCSRGVAKQGSTTVTSALRGAIKDLPSARAEFLGIAKP